MVAYSVICVAGVAVVDWRVLAVSWLVWGIAYGPEEILTDVALVTHTPSDLLGRTYGGISTVSSIGSAIGAIAGGLLGDLAGPRLVVAGLAACYLPAAAAIWWAFDRPPTR
jgi:predicted MFS family arabinose efflux permease